MRTACSFHGSSTPVAPSWPSGGRRYINYDVTPPPQKIYINTVHEVGSVLTNELINTIGDFLFLFKIQPADCAFGNCYSFRETLLPRACMASTEDIVARVKDAIFASLDAVIERAKHT